MAQPPNNQHLPRVRESQWVVGELLAHGPAPYRFDEQASPSYFIRLRTAENEEGARRRREAAHEAERPIDGRVQQRAPTRDEGGIVELWGTDLKRAIAYSKSRVEIGQTVAARVVRRESLDPGTKVANPNAYRNRWEVERPTFISQRQQFARQVNEDYRAARRRGVNDPEGLALYLIHDGAERLARLRFPNPEDQQRFLERIRHILEVSPEREGVIARAVQLINQRKAAQAAGTYSRTEQSGSGAPERSAEPRVRE